MSVQLKVSRAWNTAIVFWLDFCRSYHRSFTARIYIYIFIYRYTVQQMGTLHLTVVGNPSLYFGASAQALAIRVKRRISWQNRASCVVQSIVLQQGAEIMSWKKTGFLVSDDLRDLPLASVKIPLAQISQIKMESERVLLVQFIYSFGRTPAIQNCSSGRAKGTQESPRDPRGLRGMQSLAAELPPLLATILQHRSQISKHINITLHKTMLP